MNDSHPAHVRTDKLTVVSWALWDLGSAAFNAVLVTFVFAVYLTDSVGKDIEGAATWYSQAIALAGVAIALVAPIMGQRSDARGTRRKSVRLWSTITFLFMCALAFVRNDAPVYFWVGITIMALASITFEFAEVNYFAQLNQVSTKENVGKVSGFGWALGYFGGIFVLLASYLLFIAGNDDGTAGLLRLSTEGGFNIRMVAVLAAVWFGVFAIPTMLRVPEAPADPSLDTGGVRASYAQLVATLKRLWREDRNALFFLISSAVFRDGLAGVFTFGAILAVSVYGFGADNVLIFGIVANVVSALGALVSGFFDDRFGPKPVIMVSLISMVLVAAALYFVEGPKNFWIFGLLLCLFVGPAQSASRTFLSRIAHDGREGQFFGLYATTGRAVSWMAPAAFALFTGLGGNDRFGILGIGLVLLLGLVLLGFVKQPSDAR